MLWWLVDNANLLYLLLAVAALVLAGRWWLTRRGEYLIGLGGAALLGGLVWVLTLLIVTDRQRLVGTVEDVARRISKQDLNGAFEHFAKEVRIELGDQAPRTLPRDALREFARMSLKQGGITGLTVWDITVDKLERPNAEVSFYIRPTGDPKFAVCRTEFVLVGETEWRVKALKINAKGWEQFLKWPG